MAEIEKNIYGRNQKITPFFWFEKEAEVAAEFYVSLFKNSELMGVSRYGDDGHGAQGSVMSVAFKLDGQDYIALNGGPHYKLTPAISLMVKCENQEEIDFLWEKLSDGGQIYQCGWLTDRFGLTWQIIPAVLGDMLGCGDPAKTQKAMNAVFNMIKLDIKTIEDAFNS